MTKLVGENGSGLIFGKVKTGLGECILGDTHPNGECSQN